MLRTCKCSIVATPAGKKMAFRPGELRKLFTEAADLARDIRISPVTYQVAHKYSIVEPLFCDDLHQFRVINQDSAQLIRKSDNIKAAQDGKIGKKLCVVHPALVRKGKNGGRDIVLVKATILCSFDRPGTRQKKTKQVTASAAVAAAQHATTRDDSRA
jgi:hypothetical protein